MGKDMKLMKTFLTTMSACCIAMLSCSKVDMTVPALHGDGIAFTLYGSGYDGVPEARSGETVAVYDNVEFAVMDRDGERVRNMKGHYDKDASEIRIEGLGAGEYTLLVLGIKGAHEPDNVEIRDIDRMSDTWIKFPDDISGPLSAEYFHSATDFSVKAVPSDGGYELVPDIDGRVAQKRIVARVDFAFGFADKATEYAVVSNKATVEVPEFYTSMSADGTLSGKVREGKFGADLTGKRQCFFLPATEGSAVEGTVEIHTKDYRGNEVGRKYGYSLDALSPNHLYDVTVDVVHPEDESGTLFVTGRMYEAGMHGRILQDDEPHQTYTDEALRSFNTAAPLQLSMSDEGKFRARFYSPKDLTDVLVRARIPSEGDFFIDLAYFERIPAFADFVSELPLTARDAFYRTDTGKIVEIGKKTPAELAGMEFRVESADAYWAKLQKIKHGWNISFSLYGGDPTRPDGGPAGNWMGIRPVHCREAVAFFLNFTYMIDMPEHEQILRDNQDRLYGNNGVDDKVSVETVLSQMRQSRKVYAGLVYTGNGVLGLGGGTTYGAYQGAWLNHYTSDYACEIMFHELGHVMGYNHSSSFTYGPWAQELMNRFYVTHLSEMPVDSPGYLDSANNPNLY